MRPAPHQIEPLMNRIGLPCVILAALLAVACGGDKSTSPSPTSPTPTPTQPNPSPTNPSCLPGVPANLAVTYPNTSTRVFTWNASSNAVDYFIGIGLSSGNSDLIYTNTSQPTYTWTGQGPGTYYARVYARNTCGSSANSTEISVH